ncbi:hypothetical protein HDU92_007748 [Lobulomyces angularis]|nr:hypothetical protein HDU92_007748 [Lobulomyces angularis]
MAYISGRDKREKASRYILSQYIHRDDLTDSEKKDIIFRLLSELKKREDDDMIIWKDGEVVGLNTRITINDNILKMRYIFVKDKFIYKKKKMSKDIDAIEENINENTSNNHDTNDKEEEVNIEGIIKNTNFNENISSDTTKDINFDDDNEEDEDINENDNENNNSESEGEDSNSEEDNSNNKKDIDFDDDDEGDEDINGNNDENNNSESEGEDSNSESDDEFESKVKGNSNSINRKSSLINFSNSNFDTEDNDEEEESSDEENDESEKESDKESESEEEETSIIKNKGTKLNLINFNNKSAFNDKEESESAYESSSSDDDESDDDKLNSNSPIKKKLLNIKFDKDVPTPVKKKNNLINKVNNYDSFEEEDSDDEIVENENVTSSISMSQGEYNIKNDSNLFNISKDIKYLVSTMENEKKVNELYGSKIMHISKCHLRSASKTNTTTIKTPMSSTTVKNSVSITQTSSIRTSAINRSTRPAAPITTTILNALNNLQNNQIETSSIRPRVNVRPTVDANVLIIGSMPLRSTSRVVIVKTSEVTSATSRVDNRPTVKPTLITKTTTESEIDNRPTVKPTSIIVTTTSELDNRPTIKPTSIIVTTTSELDNRPTVNPTLIPKTTTISEIDNRPTIKPSSTKIVTKSEVDTRPTVKPTLIDNNTVSKDNIKTDMLITIPTNESKVNREFNKNNILLRKRNKMN